MSDVGVTLHLWIPRRDDYVFAEQALAETANSWFIPIIRGEHYTSEYIEVYLWVQALKEILRWSVHK